VPVAVGPLDFSLLLFCILALFLAPEFLIWKNIYMVNFERHLAFHKLESTELWADPDGRAGVEFDLKPPLRFFRKKVPFTVALRQPRPKIASARLSAPGASSPAPRTHTSSPWRAPLRPTTATLELRKALGHGGLGFHWATWTQP